MRSAAVGRHNSPEVISQMVMRRGVHISQPQCDGATSKGRTLQLKH